MDELRLSCLSAVMLTCCKSREDISESLKRGAVIEWMQCLLSTCNMSVSMSKLHQALMMDTVPHCVAES